MRIRRSEYSAQPWRIHAIAPDFTVEDVWELPTPGGRDDLARLVRQFASDGKEQRTSAAYRTLFAIRWRGRSGSRTRSCSCSAASRCW